MMGKGFMDEVSRSFEGGEFVCSRDKTEINYQAVLDDFKNAKQVRILTYNISKKNYKNYLIDAIKSLKEDVDVQIITNIPSRMNYYANSPAGDKYKERYQDTFIAYLERLNPENFPSNPVVGFNFHNHAKIIGTDNIVYIGSANFSDESKDNIESGVLIRDKKFVKRLYDEEFPAIMKESTPYFDDYFNAMRLFVISMETKFAYWLRRFDDEIVFISPHNGKKYLAQEFNFDAEDLEELDADIDELRGFEGIVEDSYSENDDDFNSLIEQLIEEMSTVDVEWLSSMTITDSPLYDFLVYDHEDKANKYISADPDAYDEGLELAVESAMEQVSEEYDTLRDQIEPDVIALRNKLEKIVKVLNKAHRETLKYADKWIKVKVDNTK